MTTDCFSTLWLLELIIWNNDTNPIISVHISVFKIDRSVSITQDQSLFWRLSSYNLIIINAKTSTDLNCDWRSCSICFGLYRLLLASRIIRRGRSEFRWTQLGTRTSASTQRQRCFDTRLSHWTNLLDKTKKEVKSRYLNRIIFALPEISRSGADAVSGIAHFYVYNCEIKNKVCLKSQPQHEI